MPAIKRVSEWLQSMGVPRGVPPTHAFKSAPFGSFRVPQAKYPEFLEVYCHDLESGSSLDVVERLSRRAPVVVDFDITFSKQHACEDGSRVFTTAGLLRALVGAHTRAIDQLHGSSLPCARAAIVMARSRSRRVNDERYKDGIHVVFPEAVVTWCAMVRIRDLVLQDDELQEAYCEAARTHGMLQTLEQALDSAFARPSSNMWQIYGSCAPSNTAGPYLVTDIVLPCGTWTHPGGGHPCARDWAFWTRELSVWVPRHEAMHVCCEEQSVLDAIELEHLVEKKTTQARLSVESGDKSALARQVTKFLGAGRAAEYRTWVQVAFALYNTGGAAMEADFDAFSQTCPAKYDGAACKRIWRSIKPQPATNPGLGIGSLIKWAREDTAGDSDARTQLNTLVRTCDQTAVRLTGPTTFSLTPQRLFIQAQSPPPTDPADLACQLVHATTSFLACHCGLAFKPRQGSNCVCAAGPVQAVDRYPDSCALLVCDLAIAGMHELQALVRELVVYVTYHRAAFPALVDCASGHAVRCAIQVPSLTSQVTSETLGTLRLATLQLDGPAPSTDACSAYIALTEATPFADVPKVQFTRTRGCGVLSKPLSMRGETRELGDSALRALRMRLESWPSTRDHLPQGTCMVSAREQMDGSVRARCSSCVQCPYARMRSCVAECSVLIKVNSLQTSAEVTCECSAFRDLVDVLGEVRLDTGRVPSGYTQEYAEGCAQSLHAQRSDIPWSEVYEQDSMRPYPALHNARLIGVAANMGVGKSKAVAEHVKAYVASEESRVVVVSANVALCQYLSADLGIANYQSLAKGEIFPGRVVVCVNR